VDGVAAALGRIAAAEGVDLGGEAAAARTPVCVCVYVAQDTRPSSERLARRVRAGAEAAGADVTHFGLLTTPQLHHIVRMANLGGHWQAGAFSFVSWLSSYGHPTIQHRSPVQAAWGGEAGYYRMLAAAWRYVQRGDAAADPARHYHHGAAPAEEQQQHAETAAAAAAMAAVCASRGPLLLDCAHGVGGPKAALLAAAMAGLVDIQPRNLGSRMIIIWF
jgi:hypothetical protein